MSKVIQFANDAAKTMTPREAMFAIRRLRRLATRVTMPPDDEAEFHRLLNEEEAAIAPHL